ncbi:hypothetical protein ASPSYDRAFT_159079 [Aspergillus sydowii CBS 593.65]|uniref:GPI anchored protein n=1 Tax=Aspergillus sydowii CBS 593.65 TaxID=1036612 RepID=A0A1L9T6F2_9EURO|nr:uncharacterized protein ASPSYDRAFT_159079 [Aspergillus sydowii CBS 593.65]OJJ55030.1 hypothetical protein ASPSYDRAFT_159079 [Aspergillus sydowii CBS 593.65]
MQLKSLLLPALASAAYAESTVTSMFIYGSGEQPLAASIVGNDASATTYSINCPPGTESDECGMGPGITVVAGDKATTYMMDDGDRFHLTANCTVSNSRAVCTHSMGGPDANFPGVETTTTKVNYMPVTVTAGSVTSAGHMTTLTGTVGASSTSSSSDSSAEETGSGSASASEGSSSGAAASKTGDSDEPTETGAASRVMAMSALGLVGVAVMGSLL